MPGSIPIDCLSGHSCFSCSHSEVSTIHWHPCIDSATGQVRNFPQDLAAGVALWKRCQHLPAQKTHHTQTVRQMTVRLEETTSEPEITPTPHSRTAHLLVVKFCRMHADDGHGLPLVAPLQRAQAGQHVDAVDAAVGPEVVHQHTTLQLPARPTRLRPRFKARREFRLSLRRSVTFTALREHI